MDYDHDKVDEMVLALLWLTPAGDGRALKGHDWGDRGQPEVYGIQPNFAASGGADPHDASH